MATWLREATALLTVRKEGLHTSLFKSVMERKVGDQFCTYKLLLFTSLTEKNCFYEPYSCLLGRKQRFMLKIILYLRYCISSLDVYYTPTTKCRGGYIGFALSRRSVGSTVSNSCPLYNSFTNRRISFKLE